MNRTHLMVIGLAAAALLGLHADTGWLFVIMATAAQSPSPIFAGYADLPGVRLWYTDSGGSGVPVVLLHANTGNADGWQYNIPGLVEAGYRVIAFDRRGWGRSRANADSGAQPGTIAEDLHALMEYLKIDRFHLVGVAGGGFAAYDYVLWHPERLRSLVVAASGGAIVDEELSKLREKTTLPGFQELASGISRSEHGLHGDQPGRSPALAGDPRQFATEGREGAAATNYHYV